jgi:hypothetical protein
MDENKFTEMEFVETEERGALKQPLSADDEMIEKAKKQLEFKEIKGQLTEEKEAAEEEQEREENGGKTRAEAAKEAKDYKTVIADFAMNITEVVSESVDDADVKFSPGESKMFADGFVDFFGVHFKGRMVAAVKMMIPILIKTVRHRAKVAKRAKEAEEPTMTEAEKIKEGIINAVQPN